MEVLLTLVIGSPLEFIAYTTVATPHGEVGDVEMLDRTEVEVDDALQLAVYPRCVNRAVFALTTKVDPATSTNANTRETIRLETFFISNSFFFILETIFELFVSCLYPSYHIKGKSASIILFSKNP